MKTVFMIYLSIGLTMFYGWILNVIAVVHSPAISLSGGMDVLRVIGIFVAPLGTVLGYFF